ncbi:3'(2'),5'-bisphosphate nucleotidase CysQ [bacterium SCSIO 12696]|nr:3'(2'),5'-bisphosphate nucleotidase CysQ [bacterium SCSIO 12696]
MYRQYLEQLEPLMQQASAAALAVYEQRDRWQVTAKSDDSPVTAADLAAHKVLVEGLPKIADIPVLSEESDITPFLERCRWQRYWLVDPLDGTKEFINGNGEFTVNVALIEVGRPVLGVVSVPVSGDVYMGADGIGATKNQKPIHCRQLEAGQIPKVVASRRHGSEEGRQALANIEAYFGEVELVQVGSSLKFCLIAEGNADCYPRFAPTCEWDTAAAQAVLEAAGGKVLGLDGKALGCNQKDSLLNPFFVGVGAGATPWLTILAGS